MVVATDEEAGFAADGDAAQLPLAAVVEAEAALGAIRQGPDVRSAVMDFLEAMVREGYEWINCVKPADYEVFALHYAQENGLRLLEVGATRPICPACAAAVEGAGARTVTPLKQVF